MVMVECLQNGLWLVNLGLVGGTHSNSNCPGTRKLHIVEGHFRFSGYVNPSLHHVW